MTTQNPPENEDWPAVDIRYQLETKASMSIRQLSIKAGYGADSLKKVLKSQWPAAEQVIAEALGKNPWEIWPSRYDQSNIPVRRAKISADTQHVNTFNALKPKK